jgi:transposase
MDEFDLPSRNQIRAVYYQGVDAVIALVESLNERFRFLEERQRTLEKRIQALEDRLAKDSHNSHKPPSSDRYLEDAPNTAKKSLRRHSGRRSGGQPGHPGTSLKQVAKPDDVIFLRCKGKCFCGRDVSRGAVVGHETRQVFDLPQIRPRVTEYRADIIACACGVLHTAEFPQNVNSPVQYGSNAKATAVYFMNSQLIPYERNADIFAAVFHMPLSEGTLNSAINRAHQSLEGTNDYIYRKVQTAHVAHFDESALYVAGKRFWLHAAGTNQFTAYQWHPKRGQEAMDAIGILPKFEGTAVHDDLPAYLGYDNCGHALCNEHHIRDLTFLYEQHHEKWAGKMIDLLLEIKDRVNRSVNAGHTHFHQSTMDNYTAR